MSDTRLLVIAWAVGVAAAAVTAGLIELAAALGDGQRHTTREPIDRLGKETHK